MKKTLSAQRTPTSRSLLSVLSLGAALMLSACGVLGGGAAPTAVPAVPTAVPATTVPSAVAKPAPATAAPSPASTSAPAATAVAAADASSVWVGNTDGQGVYVRNTPVMADKARPYPDGTPLSVIGDDVDGDGQHWKHIKTPDGLEGYVPSIYTVNSPP